MTLTRVQLSNLITNTFLAYVTTTFSLSNMLLISKCYLDKKSEGFNNAAAKNTWDAITYCGMLCLFLANSLSSQQLLRPSQHNNRGRTRKAVEMIAIAFRLPSIMNSLQKTLETVLKSEPTSYFCAIVIGIVFLPTEIAFYRGQFNAGRRNNNCVRIAATACFGISVASLYVMSITKDMAETDQLSQTQQHSVAIVTFAIICLGTSLGYSNTVTGIIHLDRRISTPVIVIGCAAMGAVAAHSAKRRLEILSSDFFTYLLSGSVFASTTAITSKFFVLADDGNQNRVTPLNAADAAADNLANNRTPATT